MENRDLSFEEALKRLEKILSILNQSDLDLEQALMLFEEGLTLINFCEEKLKEARMKIEVLLKGKDGFILESLNKAQETLKNG